VFVRKSDIYGRLRREDHEGMESFFMFSWLIFGNYSAGGHGVTPPGLGVLRGRKAGTVRPPQRGAPRNDVRGRGETSPLMDDLWRTAE
jgi:hypothetical protein